MEPNYAMKFFIAYGSVTKVNDSRKELRLPLFCCTFYFSYACHRFVLLTRACHCFVVVITVLLISDRRAIVLSLSGIDECRQTIRQMRASVLLFSHVHVIVLSLSAIDECRQNRLARLCQTNCKYYATKLCYKILHRKVYFFCIAKKWFVQTNNYPCVLFLVRVPLFCCSRTCVSLFCGCLGLTSVVKTNWQACAKPIANIMEPNCAMNFFITKRLTWSVSCCEAIIGGCTMAACLAFGSFGN